MNTNAPHIVFAGGGTGGHLFPGLAVAGRLREQVPSARITFVGPGRPLDCEHVEAAGYAYRSVPCRPAPRRPWDVPHFLLKNLGGYSAARRLLRQEHVDLVVGLGGYASAPVARAAKGCGARLVLLEQNVEPGRATRWLARWADAVCVAFDETARRLSTKTQVCVTGTPLRPGFERIAQGGPPRLLVLGGSHGAASLNQNVPRALYRVRQHLEGWEIVHQSGASEVESTRALYAKFGLPAIVVPFVRNMPRVLGRAEVVVSRAGGSTLAELAAVGAPAVLVPYPRATADHQLRNAELFHRRAGCPVVDERKAGGHLDEALADVLLRLLAEPARRERIAYTMQRLGRPDAAGEIVRYICRLLVATGCVLAPVAIDGASAAAYYPRPWEMDIHNTGKTPWPPTPRRRSARSPSCGPI